MAEERWVCGVCGKFAQGTWCDVCFCPRHAEEPPPPSPDEPVVNDADGDHAINEGKNDGEQVVEEEKNHENNVPSPQKSHEKKRSRPTPKKAQIPVIEVNEDNDPLVQAFVAKNNFHPTVRRGDTPCPWINIFNDEKLPFDYFPIERNLYHPGLTYIPEAGLEAGCDCVGGDCSTKKCACRHGDGATAWYYPTPDGPVLRSKQIELKRRKISESSKKVRKEDIVVMECNEKCPCGAACKNRPMQSSATGVNAKLEAFHTGTSRGWGVRTLQYLPAGGFVAQYVGEYVKESVSRARQDKFVWSLPTLNKRGAAVVIDATQFGNITRFLNHACTYQCNIMAIPIVPAERDSQFSLVGFFVGQLPILPFQELTFDYDSIEASTVLCTCEADCKCNHCFKISMK